VPLLTSDLAKTELESSRQFLLGFSSALVSYCHISLSKRFTANGAAAFDVNFIRDAFQGYYQVEQVDDTSRLFLGYSQSSSPLRSTHALQQFDGATRFFFLTCLCLRVAVRNAFRTQSDFLQKDQHIWSMLENLADAKESIPPGGVGSLAVVKPNVTALLGWQAYLEDPDLVRATTEVALVQLGWIHSLAANEDGKDLRLVPDWMCREPARWITKVAQRASHLMKPSQTDRAVEYATRLLDLGSSSGGASSNVRFTFSPIVTTALIDIISAFVQVSVRRARAQAEVQKFRQKRLFADDSRNDDWDIDIYSSFDSRDSGVTVFTNELVRTLLCPTLARTLVDVGIVEGFDMEKDDSFSKHGAKLKIAELISRLWYHPSSKFRESFATISDKDLIAFTSSVASETAVCLNFGLEALTKIYTNEKQSFGSVRTNIDNAMLNQTTQAVVGQLFATRGYLWTLSTISLDDRVAMRLGGAVQSLDRHSFSGIANMLINVLEAITSSDGGTKSDHENVAAGPTSKFIDSNVFSSLSSEEKKRLVHDVVRQRIRNKVEYGLDVACLCRVMLALFARWHSAAAIHDERGNRTSPLLKAVAQIEDWDHERANAVFERLVVAHNLVGGNECDNSLAILQSDGHVDHVNWEMNYIDKDVSQDRKRNRRTSAINQRNLASISAQMANYDSIKAFLSDLEREISDTSAYKSVEVSRIPEFESTIFCGETWDDAMYTSALSEWVVSSEPFASGKETFAHYYDKVARNRMAGSAKTLVKEARRCHKLLADPSANSAIYLCFAEERMDLCRAVVTGPIDTPYAHGLFVFDIYFPQSYPLVPPMITLMTTGMNACCILCILRLRTATTTNVVVLALLFSGGGRVRFNPNLYVDGKVCLSLLGVASASDDSQRWNKDLSSLAQVLLSIQSQILGVSEPYYNEGNGVSPHLRGTREGNAGSEAYSRTIRLANLRYAMIDILRHPPRGFEEVVSRHFALCRRRIAMQSKRWMLEAAATARRSQSRENDKIHAQFSQLHADLLSLLKESPSSNDYSSLKALESDANAVSILDPSSHWRMAANSASEQVGNGSVANEKKIAARTTLDSNATATGNARQQVPANFNPWAFPHTVSPQSTKDTDTGHTSDDELYE
jgi:ubiquitin-protein ligase